MLNYLLATLAVAALLFLAISNGGKDTAGKLELPDGVEPSTFRFIISRMLYLLSYDSTLSAARLRYILSHHTTNRHGRPAQRRTTMLDYYFTIFMLNNQENSYIINMLMPISIIIISFCLSTFYPICL